MNPTIIEANKKTKFLNLKELYNYRELLYLLTYRDFRAKYAQTVLGLFWGFLKPVLTLFVISIIFGRVVNVKTGSIPYPIFALSGMVGWSYFAAMLGMAGSSLIGSQAIIKKVYFPRLIVPIAKVGVSFVDYLITLLFLFIMLPIYGAPFTWKLIFIIPLTIWVILIGTSIGVWLSAMAIRFRDLLQISPIFVKLGYYVSPIVYPSSMVPEAYLPLYYINPMAGLIDLFRWATVGADFPSQYVGISMVVTLFLMISSVWAFNRVERKMADLL